MNQNTGEELKALSHEAWPGFTKIFIVVFAVLSLYLAVIVLSAPDGGFIDPAHHSESGHH